MKWLGLVVSVLVMGACALELSPRPRPPAAPPRSTSLGLAIDSRTLRSGLRVVTVRDPRATEVQVTMRYQVGAGADGDHPGIAHLVEHLMFQQDLDGQAVFTHLEDIATYFNAATTFDATTYTARGPTSALDKLLAIEAMRLEHQCGTVTDVAFMRERQVVLSELEQRDQAGAVYHAVHSGLYPEGHPYRQHVGGNSASVNAITREQACAFATTYYAPNNAVLVISGPLQEGELDAALAKIDGQIAKRIGTSPRQVPPVSTRPQHVEVPAPIDENVLVLAWPLPAEPRLRATVRAIGASLPRLVDAEIKGTVVGIELGDTSAPMYGIAVLPGDDETFKEAIEGTRRGIANLPSVFRDSQPDNVDQVLFDRVKQSAIYGVYAGLEDGSGRDERLAAAVLAGLDPRAAVAGELGALASLSRETAAELASRYFGVSTPTVVTLEASASKKRGDKLTLQAPTHDPRQRRTTVDPELAFKPAPLAANELAGAKTRVLPNGLKVVLLPVTTVPTFEARLIFGAGTADEPEAVRGVALVAAHTLTWDLHHINDVFAFVRAGGMRNTDVGTDRTSFSVQGLDMNLDVVLAALRRWVRDGVYDDSASNFVNAMRRVSKRTDDQGILTDAWRAALFGADHPYVKAGLARHANAALTVDDARGFRSRYYTPDNATLVIAGRFDAALADRWIDFLFADWSGRAAARQVRVATPQPASIAMAEDTTLVQLRIAIPAEVDDRARRLVTAALLGDIARDVRHRLGASYTFDAQLVEWPAASFYVIGGFVDAARAKEVFELLDHRIRDLRSNATAAASAFVIARSHVLTQLRSRIGSASALADRVHVDVEMARPPMSDFRTSRAVAGLTIGDMAAALAELELGRATMLVDGPAGDIEALAALGRTPAYVRAPDAVFSGPGATPPVFTAAEQHVLRSEVVPALTLQPKPRLALVMTAHMTLSVTGLENVFSGYSLSGGVGYRYGFANAIGLHVSGGHLTSGDASTLVPINALAMLHLGGTGRTWADLLFGMHLERRGRDWSAAPLYGAQVGVDLLGGMGIGFRWESAFRTDDAYGAWSIGLGYRR
ncbi:MAG TPA: insulinase family protein [Kofleriaceae bacterium]|nr:insulinase family protein [Kofleriaceae bacterium]